MAARTLLITSGVMLCMLWAVLACSLAFLRTSSSELPRSSTLHPGTTSPHFRTLVMRSLLALGGKGIVGRRLGDVKGKSGMTLGEKRQVKGAGLKTAAT